MKKKYIVALDEGTTSTRSILVDSKGEIVASVQNEFDLSYPKSGWVEMNPSEVYASQYGTMTEVIAANISPSEIAAVAITNQRETTIVWNRHTGKPIYPGIVWQCRRTAEECDRLRAEGWGEKIFEKTGLVIDAYFSASKIRWILDHVEGARELANKGELLFGTVDTWLLWKMTNGKVHKTDRTNASRTMLYNIHDLCWDKELLELFGVPESMLPEVCSSGEIYGTVDLFGQQIPIAGIAGDQQAALFGQKCFKSGEAKCTYGTGCFLLMQTGEEACASRSGLVTTIAAGEKGAPVQYALEGSVFMGGAIIQWIRDALGLIREARDSEYFAGKVKDTGGVYIVPAFAGLGAPYWDMYARGTIVGLTRGSDRNHLIRAALESIAYQSEDLIAAMENDTGRKISSLKADGGASANRFLMQFQSDISDTEVICGAGEATSLGVAYLAGLAVGMWSSREEILSLRSPEDSGRRFRPKMTEEERRARLDGWKQAVRRTRSFEN
ncbi:MAG: glycerol kinase GlpK [Clostridia bacterium]|nr:glycerol kinase GlpK [Clostridia bacterium]